MHNVRRARWISLCELSRAYCGQVMIAQQLVVSLLALVLRWRMKDAAGQCPAQQESLSAEKGLHVSERMHAMKAQVKSLVCTVREVFGRLKQATVIYHVLHTVLDSASGAAHCSTIS